MKENDCLHVQGNSTLLNSRSQQRDFDFTPRSNHTGNTNTHTYSFATSLWTVSTSIEWITTLHDTCVQTERTWIPKGIKISALSCRALGLFVLFFFSMASILPLVDLPRIQPETQFFHSPLSFISYFPLSIAI